MPPEEGDLVDALMHASRAEGRALLLAHLHSGGGNAGAVADALLQRPQPQLRAHGLLAARLAGQSDVVLGVLVSGDPGTWRAAASLLCQMPLDDAGTARLLHWLLHDAAPAQRKDFLTRLGRLPARPLGANLFSALMAEGRPHDALRLLRHAGALSDADVEQLARANLVAPQGARQRVPTWARQAWRRLALARPLLCLQLLSELWEAVRREVGAKQNDVALQGAVKRRYTALLMVRRAVLTLLHGVAGREAAEALLVSREAYQTELEERSVACSLDARLLAAPKRTTAPFAWYRARQDMRLLQEAGTSPEAKAKAARTLCLASLLQPAATTTSRWAHRLQRKGVLVQVLQQASLQGHAAGATAVASFFGGSLSLLRAVRLAAGADAAQEEELLAGMVAADLQQTLFPAQGSSVLHDTPGYRLQPWRLWLCGSSASLAHWPPATLARGASLLMQHYEAGAGGDGSAGPGDSGGGVNKRDVLERLRSYLLWEPSYRDALMQGLRTNRPLADERAQAYSKALEHDVPAGNAAAVNEVVPFVLGRMRNERASLCSQVLGSLYRQNWSVRPEQQLWEHAPPLLQHLADEHLPVLEAALLAALDTPDRDDKLAAVVAGVTAETMRQGVLRPHGAKLACGLRMQAELLRRFGAAGKPGIGGGGCADAGRVQGLAPAEEKGVDKEVEEEEGVDDEEGRTAGEWRPDLVHELAVAPDTLAASKDPRLAVQTLLASLLPLYEAHGLAEAAAVLLRDLTDGTNAGSTGGSAESPASKPGHLHQLEGLPELHEAVEKVLRRRFPKSAWGDAASNGDGAATARPGEAEEAAGPRAGIASGGGSGRRGRGVSFAAGDYCACRPWEDVYSSLPAPGVAVGACVESCMAWWVEASGEDGQLALRRAKALLELPGGAAALREFVVTPVCRKWLLAADGSAEAASPAVRWWRENVCSTRPALQALTDRRPRLCRQLLASAGSSFGGRLCQALLKERLLPLQLCGACVEFDRAALAEPLAALDRGSPAASLTATAGFAQGAEGSYWEVKRQLGSTDYRRWPPALQEQMRRLFAAAATSSEAGTSLRAAAVCLLARLQGSSCADLEPLADDPQLTAACLLTAQRLADKQEAARFLQSRLAGDDATHAASALRRLAAFLPDAELAELGGDLLSTVGLRVSAWQQVVALLLERGSPKVLELVWAEMRRPDLTPSMRCGLLSATAPLCALPQVAAFWEECAALMDKEVGADVLASADVDLLQSSATLTSWWAGVAVRMLKRAATEHPDLALAWAGQLAASQVVKAYKNHPAELDPLLSSLLVWAYSAPAKGWAVAVWLLQRMLGSISLAAPKPGEDSAKLAVVRGSLARRLRPLLELAAAEQQQLGAAAGTRTEQAGGQAGAGSAAEAEAAAAAAAVPAGRPASSLLLQLLEGRPSAGGRVPTPWELELEVPPVLVPVLWPGYCAYLAARVGDPERLPGADGAASLAAELAAGAAAAPTAAHAMALAAGLLRQGCPKCRENRFCYCGGEDPAGTYLELKGPGQRLHYMQALLQVARQLAPQPQPAQPAHAPAAAAGEARQLLADAVAAVGWLTAQGHEGEGLRAAQAALLAELRRRAVGSTAERMLRLLLDDHLGQRLTISAACDVEALDAELQGPLAAQARATISACHAAAPVASRGARGRRGQGRLAVRITWSP